MNQKIKSTSKKFSVIVNKSKKAPRIEKKVVIEGLGAGKNENVEITQKGGPLEFFALRQELYERLRSTGGRRSLEGVNRRQKIPLSEEDWEALQRLAEQSQNEKMNPSPAQVASVLLHQALKDLEKKTTKV